MRIVHSYWSRPMLQSKRYGLDCTKQLIGNIWLFSLSVAYLKQYPNVEVVLHTDTFGKSLLGHLPYDEIHLTLDDVPTNIHPRFWACGKLVAMQNEPIGSTHIDGDVFLKKQSLIDEIDKHDFVVQCLELAEFLPHYRTEMATFAELQKVQPSALPKWFDTHNFTSINAGVIKYNNAEFGKEYFDAYMQLATMASKYIKGRLDKGEFLSPDIIAEQLVFKQLCDLKGIKPHCILRPLKAREDAEEKGYQHMFTYQKYRAIEQVSTELETINPSIFNQTEKLCQNI